MNGTIAIFLLWLMPPDMACDHVRICWLVSSESRNSHLFRGSLFATNDSAGRGDLQLNGGSEARCGGDLVFPAYAYAKFQLTRREGRGRHGKTSAALDPTGLEHEAFLTDSLDNPA